MQARGAFAKHTDRAACTLARLSGPENLGRWRPGGEEAGTEPSIA